MTERQVDVERVARGGRIESESLEGLRGARARELARGDVNPERATTASRKVRCSA